jgi:hypothetical protein
MFSKKLVSLMAALIIAGGMSSNAFAELFSVSVGIPIQHTFSSEWEGGDAVESESVSGAMVHVKFPVMLGVGYETYQTSIKSYNDSVVDDINLSINMLDLFWLTPIPIVNFTIGVGVGTSTLDCKYSTGDTCADVFEAGGFASAYQLYAQLGFNFLPFLDAHLSYHGVTAKVKEKDSGDTSSFNGNVIGLGVAFIF